MAATDPHGVGWATCVAEGVYSGALAYGETYAILALDRDKRQVKVRGDNGRARWYPSGCFDLTGRPVPKIVRILPCESIERPPTSAVEVEMELSDGQRRWCYFTSPELLAQLSGDIDLGAERLLSYGAPHMIVVSAITRDTIQESLRYIERQGRLLDCTRAIE